MTEKDQIPENETMTPELPEVNEAPQPEETVQTEAPAAQPKKKKTLRVLLVAVLMLVSFTVGWRFMAYQWWPRLSPYVKQAVYAVIPSLKPQETPAAATPVEEYHPRSDAQVGDPISATDSLFYYFYFPTCPYCATNGNMLLAGLPEYITLPDGTRSRVVMIALNKHDDQEYTYIEHYYTEHGVVKDDVRNEQIVPSIVIGDNYLMGSAGLRNNFYKMLLDGVGLTTPLIDGGERVD